MWEKSRARAPELTRPILPMRQGIPERQTHNYARHGVTCLFAALNTATGQVTDACYPRHRHQEFLRFLKRPPPPTPAKNCTSSATTTPPQARPGKAWLA